MKNKIIIISELLFVSLYLVSIIFSSSWIINLAGYTSIIRLFLICAVPILMVILPAILCKHHHFSLLDLGYKKQNIGKQLMWAITLVFLWICLTLLLPLSFGADITTLIGKPYYGYRIIIFRLIYYFFFIGFTEEFIFRGYYHIQFKKITSSIWISILISGFLFGLMHYISSQSIALVIETTFAGITYGIFAHKIENSSVLTTSIAHGLYDAILVIIACMYY